MVHRTHAIGAERACACQLHGRTERQRHGHDRENRDLTKQPRSSERTEHAAETRHERPHASWLATDLSSRRRLSARVGHGPPPSLAETEPQVTLTRLAASSRYGT